MRSLRLVAVLGPLAALLAPGCYEYSGIYEVPPDPVIPECAVDTDCASPGGCMAAQCLEGACGVIFASAGTVCGGDLCTGAATCDGAGLCNPGTPVSTDDGNACTQDSCDPVSGIVTHTPISACGAPIPTTGAPAARRQHAAVWTGTEMIVWGGTVAGSPSLTSTGGRYDPAAGAWKATSVAGAPPARHSACAAWTGTKMLVWGGFAAAGLTTTGGAYDPTSDSWSAMSPTGAPPGRVGAACAWTGTELVVWGGTASGKVLASGGRYDPATDTWKSLPASGAPSARYGQSGVWSGKAALIWGGNDLFDWHADGAAYDPTTDVWTPLAAAGAPAAREQHTAIWTGARMVVWGGFDGGSYLGDGGSLDLENGWTALAAAGAPSPRSEHAAVWTGNQMIVWSGCGKDSCAELYADGGVWTPDAAGGSWSAVAAPAFALPRRGATGVWTGSSALFWGGRGAKGETDTGIAFSP